MAGSRIRTAALLGLLGLSTSVVYGQCLSSASITSDKPVTLSICAGADVTSLQTTIDDRIIHDGPVTASGVDVTTGATLFPMPPVTLSAGTHTVKAAVRNEFGVSPIVTVATLTAAGVPSPTPDPTPTPTPTPPPAPCVPVLAPSVNLAAPAAGITAEITVTVGPGCAWQATSGASYLHITPSSGTGPGSLIYAVDPNTAEAREQDIGFGGATFHVHQLAGTAPAPPPTPTPTPTPPPVPTPSPNVTCTDGQAVFQVGAVLWQPNVKVQGLVASTAIYQRMIAAHWTYTNISMKVKGNVYNLQFRCGA